MLALVLVAVLAFAFGRISKPAKAISSDGPPQIVMSEAEFNRVMDEMHDAALAGARHQAIDERLELQRKIVRMERERDEALIDMHMLRMERDRLLERLPEAA